MVLPFKKICVYLSLQRNIKKANMEKVTKEELLKAIKKAKKHKNEARKKTAKEWKREGIKGKVVLI